MKKFSLILSIAFFFVACGGNEPAKTEATEEKKAGFQKQGTEYALTAAATQTVFGGRHATLALGRRGQSNLTGCC